MLCTMKRLFLVDAVEKVNSEEALSLSREVIREEGILFGISSGAALAAGLRVAAREENKDKVIVVIIPSYTERYLSTALSEKELAKARALPVEEVPEVFLQEVH